MECICRDLGRHLRFRQERYSRGYYGRFALGSFASSGESQRWIGLESAQSRVPEPPQRMTGVMGIFIRPVRCLLGASRMQ